jgi:hypothetical protein
MSIFPRAAVHHAVMYALAALAVALASVPSVARTDDGPGADGWVEFVNSQGNRVTYSFSAETEHDGRIEGEVVFHVDRADGNVVDARGKTLCVGVNGTVARVGARLERLAQNGVDVKAESGFIDMYFTVLDNGERAAGDREHHAGPANPTDMASNMLFGKDPTVGTLELAIRHCMTGFSHPLFALRRGDVEVRTGEADDAADEQP